MSDYWYALVGASPRPDTGEVVSVGIVVGNGAPYHVAFEKALPRLKGIASDRERYMFREVMKALRDRVARGSDIHTLRSTFGPQILLGEPVGLYEKPSEETLRLLCGRYLSAPSDDDDATARTLVERSILELDHRVSRYTTIGLQIEQDVKPDQLYGMPLVEARKISVPKIARVFRSSRRDLMVDAIRVDSATLASAMRVATTRINRAFFGYRRLESDILKLTGRHIELVGVLHPSEPGAPSEVMDAREYIKHVWATEASVVDLNLPDSDQLLADCFTRLTR